MTDEKLEKVEKLKHVAKEIGCTVAQLALAWILQQRHISVALLGATKASQVCFHTPSRP